MSWFHIDLQNEGPAARECHSFNAIDYEIYMFGGNDQANRHSDVQVLNTFTMKWSSRQVRGKYRPSKRSAHSSVVVDGSKLFMFGGWDGQQELGDLMVFDTEASEWAIPETSGEPPAPRHFHVSAFVGRRLYIFGGYDGHCWRKDVCVLNVDTMTWEPFQLRNGSPSPGPRASASMAAIGSESMILFGGYDGEEFLSDLWFLHTHNPTTGEKEFWWEQVSRPPAPAYWPASRSGHAGECVDGRWFVVVAGRHRGGRLNDLVVFDTVTRTWTNVRPNGKTIVPRKTHAVSAIGYKLYVFGGHNGEGWQNDLWMVDIAPFIAEIVAKRSIHVPPSSLLYDLSRMYGTHLHSRYQESGMAELTVQHLPAVRHSVKGSTGKASERRWAAIPFESSCYYIDNVRVPGNSQSMPSALEPERYQIPSVSPQKALEFWGESLRPFLRIDETTENTQVLSYKDRFHADSKTWTVGQKRRYSPESSGDVSTGWTVPRAKPPVPGASASSSSSSSSAASILNCPPHQCTGALEALSVLVPHLKPNPIDEYASFFVSKEKFGHAGWCAEHVAMYEGAAAISYVSSGKDRSSPGHMCVHKPNPKLSGYSETNGKEDSSAISRGSRDRLDSHCECGGSSAQVHGHVFPSQRTLPRGAGGSPTLSCGNKDKDKDKDKVAGFTPERKPLYINPYACLPRVSGTASNTGSTAHAHATRGSSGSLPPATGTLGSPVSRSWTNSPTHARVTATSSGAARADGATSHHHHHHLPPVLISGPSAPALGLGPLTSVSGGSPSPRTHGVAIDPAIPGARGRNSAPGSILHPGDRSDRIGGRHHIFFPDSISSPSAASPNESPHPSPRTASQLPPYGDRDHLQGTEPLTPTPAKTPHSAPQFCATPLHVKEHAHNHPHHNALGLENLGDGILHDCAFLVQGQIIPGQKAILGARSPVFEAMFRPGKYGWVESAPGTLIPIEGTTPAAFSLFLQYLYTDTLPSEPIFQANVADLMALGERYCVDRLSLICQAYLEAQLTPDTVYSILEFAIQQSSIPILEAAIEYALTMGIRVEFCPLLNFDGDAAKVFLAYRANKASGAQDTVPKEKATSLSLVSSSNHGRILSAADESALASVATPEWSPEWSATCHAQSLFPYVLPPTQEEVEWEPVQVMVQERVEVPVERSLNLRNAVSTDELFRKPMLEALSKSSVSVAADPSTASESQEEIPIEAQKSLPMPDKSSELSGVRQFDLPSECTFFDLLDTHTPLSPRRQPLTPLRPMSDKTCITPELTKLGLSSVPRGRSIVLDAQNDSVSDASTMATSSSAVAGSSSQWVSFSSELQFARGQILQFPDATGAGTSAPSLSQTEQTQGSEEATKKRRRIRPIATSVTGVQSSGLDTAESGPPSAPPSAANTPPVRRLSGSNGSSGSRGSSPPVAKGKIGLPLLRTQFAVRNAAAAGTQRSPLRCEVVLPPLVSDVVADATGISSTGGGGGVEAGSNAHSTETAFTSAEATSGVTDAVTDATVTSPTHRAAVRRSGRTAKGGHPASNSNAV